MRQLIMTVAAFERAFETIPEDGFCTMVFLYIFLPFEVLSQAYRTLLWVMMVYCFSRDRIAVRKRWIAYGVKADMRKIVFLWITAHKALLMAHRRNKRKMRRFEGAINKLPELMA